MQKEQKKNRGRIPVADGGTPNLQYSLVQVRIGRCPKCQSTNRVVIRKSKEELDEVRTNNAGPYKRIVERKVKCGKCGHPRIEQSYELD